MKTIVRNLETDLIEISDQRYVMALDPEEEEFLRVLLDR